MVWDADSSTPHVATRGIGKVDGEIFLPFATTVEFRGRPRPASGTHPTGFSMTHQHDTVGTLPLLSPQWTLNIHLRQEVREPALS